MRLAIVAALALVGCSDLSRPSSLRVSKDRTGTESQVAVAPDNLIRVKGPDGKVVEVPRLHPPGTKDAGMPILPGQAAQRPAPSAAPR
ncbi:MAG: hypothetical protein FJ095_19145 [Deltaproteobacteria bacterium]|nr:hypothetical protein [Deltaproteobacteria bacterium]